MAEPSLKRDNALIDLSENSLSESNLDESLVQKAKKTYENRKISNENNSEMSLSSTEGSLLLAATTSSPNQNTSRYGRARKPKITEDFYNIEDIFGPYERIPCSPLRSPKKKPSKLELSPNKSNEIVTLDADVNIKILNSTLSINIPADDSNLIEVNKVMKIVSNNDFSPKSPTNFSLKNVKTYGNKNKRNSECIVESFALPDYPTPENCKQLNGVAHDEEIADETPSKTNDASIFKSVRLFSDDSFNSNDGSTNDKSSLSRSKFKCLSLKSAETIESEKSLESPSKVNEVVKKKLYKKNKSKVQKRPLPISAKKYKTKLRSSFVDHDAAKQEDNTEKTDKSVMEVNSERSDDEHTTKIESKPFFPIVGSLAWSRVGSYPFWPSIVSYEPGTTRFFRSVTFGKRLANCYHVNFFGDNGRRSWVLATHIFPFNRRSDLEIMAQSVSKDSKPKDPKHLSAFIINPNKLKKWETAVTEAENITDYGPDVRIQKFFEMVSPKKKSLKREFPALQSPTKHDKKYKRLKLEKKAANLKKKYQKKNLQKKIPAKDKPDIKDDNVAIVETKIKEEPVEDRDRTLRKTRRSELTNELLKKKTVDYSDDSLSEAESKASKNSDFLIRAEQIRDTPSPVAIVSFTARQKRINIFRGVTKERVCQVCGTNKGVFKCKGNCFGLYHLACEKQLRARVFKQEKARTELENSAVGAAGAADARNTSDGTVLEAANGKIVVSSILQEILLYVFDKDMPEEEIQEELSESSPETIEKELMKIDDDETVTKETVTKDFSAKNAEEIDEKTNEIVKIKDELPDQIETSLNNQEKPKESQQNPLIKEETTETVQKSSEITNKLHINKEESQKSPLNSTETLVKIENDENPKEVIEDVEKTMSNHDKETTESEINEDKSLETVEHSSLVQVTKNQKESDKENGTSSQSEEDLKEIEEKSSQQQEIDKNSLEIVKIDDKLTEQVEISSQIEENSSEISKNKEEKPVKIVEISKKRSSSASLSLAEQIDLKMQEVMENLITQTKYSDSNTDDSSDPESTITEPQKAEKATSDSEDSVAKQGPTKASKRVIKHVTADGIFDVIQDPIPEEEIPDLNNFKCVFCTNALQPPCFICNADVGKLGGSKKHRCMTPQCGKYYHAECLKDWPQTKWYIATKSKKIDNENLSCPYHNCHTCISDDPRAPLARYTNEKLAKCIRCPTTYHINNFCIPAGTEILSTYQIICPKHLTYADANAAPPATANAAKKAKAIKPPMHHVNAAWCFICSMGGSLICCETCPSSFHVECLKLSPPEGRYLCEECESGRLPLYDEIVWVKLGSYRWWPAQILYPADIPPNLLHIPHSAGEFVVRFFGSHDHYWVNRGRVFLFQEGDSGHSSNKKSAVDGLFLKAISEATSAHKKFIGERKNREIECREAMKPPSYVKIKVNKPVGDVRTLDQDTSNATPCGCDPVAEEPCGPDSDCINRILLTECNPMVCAAGSRCCNQAFQNRTYAPVAPFKTSGRGWGLKTMACVTKGSFVIEYVGEVINEKEYQRRMQRKHEQKDENYYFLTIDKDRMIDAGPKGNVARFMNHSCSPNCETQKWTVNGDTKVGLFAIMDIPLGAELTFNYNLECIGEEKKECRCGAPNCSGFIGVKAKQDEMGKKRKTALKQKKKKPPISETKTFEIVACFVCGAPDAIQQCDREQCNKFYHLRCVSLEAYQEGKWFCPWHSCNVCTKRTTRCCYTCTNSYCPLHSEGNIRYDRVKGFICSQHDVVKDAEPVVTKPNRNSSDVEHVSEEKEANKTKELPVKAKKLKAGSKELKQLKVGAEHDNAEGKTSGENSRRSSKNSTIAEQDESTGKEPEKKNKIGGKKMKHSKTEELNEKTKDSADEDTRITLSRKSFYRTVKSDETKAHPTLEKEENKEKKTAITKNGLHPKTIAEQSTNNTPTIKKQQMNDQDDKGTSIKKRKSRLSLKQNNEFSDDDDNVSLFKLKKIKLQAEKSENRDENSRKSKINNSTTPKGVSTGEAFKSKSETKSAKNKTPSNKKGNLSLVDSVETDLNDFKSASNKKKAETLDGQVKKKPGRPRKVHTAPLLVDNQDKLKSHSPKHEEKPATTAKIAGDVISKIKSDFLTDDEPLNSSQDSLDSTTNKTKKKTSLNDVLSPDTISVRLMKLKNPRPGIRKSLRINPNDFDSSAENSIFSGDENDDFLSEVTSSKVKPGLRQSMRRLKPENEETELEIDLEQSTLLDDSAASEDTPDGLKRKRGRPRKYPVSAEDPQTGARRPIGRPRKHKLLPEPEPRSVESATELYRMKLNSDAMPKNPYDSHVTEVKLTANVPERHLRVVLRKHSEIDTKNDSKFLQMQNDIERDLPIRKRSKLRYEAQL